MQYQCFSIGYEELFISTGWCFASQVIIYMHVNLYMYIFSMAQQPLVR